MIIIAGLAIDNQIKQFLFHEEGEVQRRVRQGNFFRLVLPGLDDHTSVAYGVDHLDAMNVGDRRSGGGESSNNVNELLVPESHIQHERFAMRQIGDRRPISSRRVDRRNRVDCRCEIGFAGARSRGGYFDRSAERRSSGHRSDGKRFAATATATTVCRSQEEVL